MGWKDQTKLYLLFFSYLLFLSTLFTSSSFSLGHRTIQTMSAPVHRFCRTPRNEVKKCLDGQDGDQQCKSQLNQASKCESVLKRAFRYINMGGCPYEIQSVAVCETEWCEGVQADKQGQADCRKECAKARKALDQCVQGHVTTFYARAGLQENGAFKSR